MNCIPLGRIGRPYGIKGWFHLHSFTTPIDNLLKYPDWHICIRGNWFPVILEKYQKHGTGFVVKLDRWNTPEEVKCFVNTDIGVPPTSLPSLPEGEYYW